MDLVGKTIGKYQILEELGRGGMGIVYKAYDPTLERQVAIKVLAPHLVWEKEFVERFLREARAAAKLDHPNIVTIYEVGHQKGKLYYFVMAYLPGKSLADIIAQRGPLPLPEALSIAEQVAAALDCAHEQGLVHRDVKASNILVDERGRAVLTDFGIVRAMHGPRLTGTGVTLGTPEYMSPEQARGEDATAASDLYSLGIILYEMLGGDVPFRATTPVAVLLKQATEAPPPLRMRNPAVPEAVERVLLQALAKEAHMRPASCTALVTALRAAARAVQPPAPPLRGLEATRGPQEPTLTPVPTVAPPAGPAHPLTPPGVPPTPAPAAPPRPLTPPGAPPTPAPAGPAPPATPLPQVPPAAARPLPATPSPLPPLPVLAGDLLATKALTEEPAAAPARPGLLRGVVEVISALNVGRLREVLRWKGEPIEDLACSPDGRRLGIVAQRRLYVLELPTLAAVHVEVVAALRCVAFSPDGQVLAAGADDRVVLQWKVDGLVPLLTLAGPRSRICSLAISPNGQVLVAGTEDGAAPLWRTADGVLLGALYGHAGRVASVAFSPFGQILATGGADRGVRLWRLADGQLLGTLLGHAGAVNRVLFSPGGMVLASAAEDGAVRLWRIADQALVEVLAGHARGVQSIAFTPDGQLLATGGRDGTVRLWQVSTGTTLHGLGGFSEGVCGVAFVPDGTAMVTAAGDGTVQVWGIGESGG